MIFFSFFFFQVSVRSCKTCFLAVGNVAILIQYSGVVLCGVLHGSVVNCMTFAGVSLGKTLQSPSLVLVKPRKDVDNVSCCCDMPEILLKAV